MRVEDRTVQGFVNAHTHLYSALAPYGMPAPERAPENFVQILERVWWRLDRALDAAALRAGARLYVAEALLHGTTTLIDHHESPEFIEGSLDVLADACEEFGIRALLCYGATERNGGRDEAKRGLAECRRLATAGRGPLIRAAVGLHASFTVSDDTLREAGELAHALGTVTHVHVAEDVADVADARRRGFEGPLERMLARQALPSGSILAHGVHLTTGQVRRVDENGLWLVQNPRSNEGNKVGYASSLRASRRVALGTDGYPADMRAEQANLHRLAEADGHDDVRAMVGRLESGHMLAVELFRHAPAGTGPQGDRVIYADDPAASPARVERVMVAGRVVVENGALVGAELEQLRAQAREQAERLWPRMLALA